MTLLCFSMRSLRGVRGRFEGLGVWWLQRSMVEWMLRVWPGTPPLRLPLGEGF